MLNFEGLVMRPEEEEGEIVYLLNVKKIPANMYGVPLL